VIGTLREDLNTGAYSRNNSRQQKALIAGILRKPGKAARHAIGRLNTFTAPQIDTYTYKPKGSILELYWLVVNAGFSALFFAAGLFLFSWARRPIRMPTPPIEACAVGCGAVLTCVLGLGEAGEEARLAVSTLPFLLCGYASLYGRLTQKQRLGD